MKSVPLAVTGPQFCDESDNYKKGFLTRRNPLNLLLVHFVCRYLCQTDLERISCVTRDRSLVLRKQTSIHEFTRNNTNQNTSDLSEV